MNSTSVLLIVILYMMLFIIYCIREGAYIAKVKQIKIISYVRFMYALIYGLVPSIVHMYYYSTGDIVAEIDYSKTGVEQIIILVLLSVVGYLGLNYGYMIRTKQKSLQNAQRIDLRNMTVSGVIILAIGFFSLLLWTKAYGSPFGIIPYADFLRSGYSEIDNPFTIMKQFCPLIMFASYIFYIILRQEQYKTRKYGWIIWFLLLFSVFWSIIYIVANDGRMMAGIYFAVFFMTKLRIDLLQEKTRIGKTIIRYIILAIVCLIAISLSEPLLYYAMYGVWGREVSVNVFVILRDEFSYTILSGQTVLTAKELGVVGFRLLTDIASGLLAWLPSRFRPDSIETLFNFNTSFIPGVTGQVPTDIISLCLYDLGIIGVAIIPFLFGMLIKKIEINFEGKLNYPYYNMLYVLVAFYMLKSVSHCDPANIMLNIFYIVVGHFVVRVVSSLKITEKQSSVQCTKSGGGPHGPC